MECESRKIPVRQRKLALQKSHAQVDAALKAIEKKMMQKQSKFMIKYVQLMKVGRNEFLAALALMVAGPCLVQCQDCCAESGSWN